jgi:signal transduction histidine kinase
MTTLRDEAVTHGQDVEALLGAVTDPMVVYDLQSQIVRANPAFHALLTSFSMDPNAGTVQERADALTLRDLRGKILPTQDQPQERMLVGEVITEADPTHVMTRGVSGVECAFSVTGGPLYHGDDVIGAVAFFRDIAEQQQLQGDLRESRDESAAIFDALTDPLFVFDADGHLIRTNPTARGLVPSDASEDLPLLQSERVFSYHVHDAHGQPLPPEKWPIARLLRGETLEGNDDAPIRVLLPDGRDMLLTYTGAPIRNEDGEITGYVALGRDITERHQAQEALRRAHDELEQRVTERTHELAIANTELRRLSRQVLKVQENERHVIAQELHDEIGQELTGAKMMLDSLDEQLRALAKDTLDEVRLPEQEPSPREQLGDVRDLVADTLKRVRELSLDLRPAILDSLGLLPALQWHFERYTQQTGVQVDFDQRGLDRRFPAEIETGAYRLIQEALTNVVRHADVRNVTVRLLASEEALKLYVVDNGVGFDADAAIASGLSTGLASMRERATLLGGVFLPSSAPGAGTTIEVEIPLPIAEAAAEHQWTSDRDAARDLARDVARDALRDAGRDSARDSARDSGRDASRDRDRDTTRDIVRDVPRDVARDVARDMAHEQERTRRADDRQTQELKEPKGPKEQEA